MTRLLPILFLFFSGCLFSQLKYDSIPYNRGNMKTSIYPAFLVGYNFSGDARDKTETWNPGQMHTLELAFAKIYKNGGRHVGGATLYAGSDFSISNKYDFFVSPKIGFNVGGGFMFGTEIQFQTNFQQFVPRIMPYLGIGGLGIRIFAGYNFRLAKAESLPINTGHIGITWPIIKGKEKK